MSTALTVQIAVPEKSEQYTKEEKDTESGELEKARRKGIAALGFIVDLPHMAFAFCQQVLCRVMTCFLYVVIFVSGHCDQWNQGKMSKVRGATR